MMKRLLCLLILSLGLSACSTGNVEDANKNKEAGAEVIKQFEATQSKVTYKDPASFAAGDAYLTPAFAKTYHQDIRAGMEQFIKQSKATVTGIEPTVTFVKEDGDNLIYNFETDRTIATEEPPSSATTHVQYVVTVTKQSDGSLLISNMEEPKK